MSVTNLPWDNHQGCCQSQIHKGTVVPVSIQNTTFISKDTLVVEVLNMDVHKTFHLYKHDYCEIQSSSLAFALEVNA